jgi:hypothetical protein
VGSLLALAVGVTPLVAASISAIAIYALIPAPLAKMPAAPRVITRTTPLVLPCEELREICKVRARMEKIKGRQG